MRKRKQVTVRLPEDQIHELRLLARYDPDDPQWNTGLSQEIRHAVFEYLERRHKPDQRAA